MSTDKEWSGSPDPDDPDNFWIDDETGERVNAETGERTPPKEQAIAHAREACHGDEVLRVECNVPLRTADSQG